MGAPGGGPPDPPSSSSSSNEDSDDSDSDDSGSPSDSSDPHSNGDHGKDSKKKKIKEKSRRKKTKEDRLKLHKTIRLHIEKFKVNNQEFDDKVLQKNLMDVIDAIFNLRLQFDKDAVAYARRAKISSIKRVQGSYHEACPKRGLDTQGGV